MHFIPAHAFLSRRLPAMVFGICILFISSCSKVKNKNIEAPGQTFTDVQYGTAPDTANRQEVLTMDIYLPADANGTNKYPLMLMIHGGGFNEGDKKDMEPHCSLLADSGYVAVAINYRLGWKVGKGKCAGDTLSEYDALYRDVQDANAALRYLVSKKEEYYIDTSHIFIGGGSAGAAIAMYTTYLSASQAKQSFGRLYNRFGALDAGGNSLTGTFTIKGILNMWGGIGDSLLINSSNAVPTISFHGMADDSSPYDIGREFSCATYPVALGSACISRQLARYGVPYNLYLKKDAAHAPSAYRAPVSMPIAIRFFNGIRKGTPPASHTVVE